MVEPIFIDLLYLHRSFFARAISDHPKDPLGSPYGTSVIAAYRSAGSLVAMMRNLYTQLKEPCSRIWFLWGHMFSCAVRRNVGQNVLFLTYTDRSWFYCDTLSVNELGSFGACAARFGLRLVLENSSWFPGDKGPRKYCIEIILPHYSLLI